MNRWTDLTLVKPRALDAARAHAATKTNANNYVYQINTSLISLISLNLFLTLMKTESI